jgi:hypothetical protein
MGNICTNIKNRQRFAHNIYVCVPYDFQNNSDIFPEKQEVGLCNRQAVVS